jgi:hypothetical protein
VVDDVAELLGEKSRVQRVAHGSDAHDRVPALQVASRVPGQRRHPIALLHAQAEQRVGEPPRALVDLAIGGPDNRPFDGARDHLGLAMPVLRVLEDPIQRQRPILNSAKHGGYVLLFLKVGFLTEP